MTADGPISTWPDVVIDWIKAKMQRDEDGAVWDHSFTSAYQMGCEALAALGQADETVWGAVPRPHPQLPDPLPRWDDCASVVLGLAGQRGLIDYRRLDGSPTPSVNGFGGFVLKTLTPPPPPPQPNISAAHGLHPARANPDLLPVLEGLGLIAGNRWTQVAVPVLWREQPRAWALDVTGDPRFAAAVDAACTPPADIRAEIDRLATITEADISKVMAFYAKAEADHIARHGVKPRLSRPNTPETARASLETGRADQLDWLFFRRWRLPDGWLSPTQASRALEIFHDPLAMAIRRAVLARLHPDKPWAQR